MFNADGSLRTPDVDEEARFGSTDLGAAAKSEPAAPPREDPKLHVVPPAAAEPAEELDADDHLPPERPGEPSLFSDLIVNLASQAAMYPGPGRQPAGAEGSDGRARRATDDRYPRHAPEKTRKNLTSEESLLLERILTDLRIRVRCVDLAATLMVDAGLLRLTFLGTGTSDGRARRRMPLRRLSIERPERQTASSLGSARVRGARSRRRHGNGLSTAGTPRRSRPPRCGALHARPCGPHLRARRHSAVRTFAHAVRRVLRGRADVDGHSSRVRSTCSIRRATAAFHRST